MAETCQTFDGWASEMNAREWIQNIRDTGGQLGVFEKYKIEEKPFAEGGFSKIYRATRDGYQFAMKIPNTVEISNGTVDIDRNTFASFREEMERWSLISNVLPDDVVCLLDYGYDPFPWMVMELADQSFEAAISSGSASIDDIRNVLTSLQNIHNIRMCHLDLKPDNILSVDGRWKLSDFGLEIVERVHRLIHPTPNYYYRYFTEQIHGISEADTHDAPRFPEVWENEIAPLIEGLPLVAHNAPFDEGALRAAHQAYGMDYPADYRFYCTLRAARRMFPKPILPNHRLPTVCEYLGIPFDHHHDALADAEGCARIALRIL